MGEPTCLMRSFSQPSQSSRDFNQEGDPARCLGESISFGRYMSEPLEWDKWSAFSSNRYIEEAERYSKPGSVAKMKAYFEAYYKTLYSKKGAAKDEESTRGSDLESSGSVVQHSSCSDSVSPLENKGNCDLECSTSVAAPKVPLRKEGSVQHLSCSAPVSPLKIEEDCKLECSTSVAAPEVPVQKEGSVQVDLESLDQLQGETSHGLEVSVQIERPQPNELEQAKCTPDVILVKLQESDHVEKLNSKKVCRKQFTSLQREPSKKGDDQEILNTKIKKLLDSNDRIPPPPYCKPPKFPTSSGRIVISPSTKEGCVTPSNKKQKKDTLQLKALPSTSLNKSIMFSPRADAIRKSSRTVLKSLIDNPLTPSATNIIKDKSTPLQTLNRASVSGKLKSLINNPHAPSAKIIKDKSTPLQTPNRASVSVKPMYTAATPQLEIKRSKSTPCRSLSRGRTRDLELQLHTLNNMNPSTSSCGFKARASVTFSPFNFRTEERAAKRREFFLLKQEREAQKIQQLEKTKQERVNTARKLLHTIDLKSKSTADTATTKSSRQETFTHPQPRPLKKKRGTLKD